MKRLSQGLLLVLVALLVNLPLGCKPKAEKAVAGTEVDAAQKLPEGTNVLAALNQKDYEAVVANLAKTQQAVSGEEQEALLLTLKQYVKQKLLDASDTDPKAAEAMQAMRMLSAGR